MQELIREPGSHDARGYQRRVRLLAAIYFALFWTCLAGIALLVWRGKMFVTLAQRSNVETLILAFFLVIFLYLAFVSRSGMVGAVRVLAYWGYGRIRGVEAAERAKQAALGRQAHRRSVALNVVLEPEQGGPIGIPIEDGFGSLGTLRIEGARLTHDDSHPGGSNDIFAYVTHQAAQILEARGVDAEIEILHWQSIDDEATAKYLAFVAFARNLSQALDAPRLWPTQVLDPEAIEALRSRLSAICLALRDEAFLPDWEYSAEHKIPVIPEPLALATLSRVEARADPVATMGLALGVVTCAVGVLGLFILRPPWVPGL